MNLNLGKIRKTLAPELTEELNGQSRANGRAVVKQPNQNVTDVKAETPTSNRKELTWGEILTVVIPSKIADWAKNIFTQVRPTKQKIRTMTNTDLPQSRKQKQGS